MARKRKRPSKALVHIAPLVPQPHGGAIRQGAHTPANPPKWFREEARRKIDGYALIDRMAKLAAGEVTQPYIDPQTGLVVMIEPQYKDQINAFRAVASIGLPARPSTSIRAKTGAGGSLTVNVIGVQ